jgi:hypothetical protein
VKISAIVDPSPPVYLWDQGSAIVPAYARVVHYSCRIDFVVDERMGGAAGLPVRPLLQPRRERGFGHDGWITSKYLGLQIPLAVWHRA